MILLVLVLAFFFWKYPAMMHQIFSLKPRTPVNPPVKEKETISSEVVRAHDKARSGEYEDIGYIHEPLLPPAPVVVEPKHKIIRHDYYRAISDGGLWPRWNCKCGGSGYYPTSTYTTVEKAQVKARQQGESHVLNGNRAEEMLEKTNGKFAW